MNYGGFWIRFIAYTVDSLILIIGLVGVAMLLGLMGLSLAGGPIIFLAVTFLYFAVLQSSSRQATFGKALVGLKVTDTNGGRISFLRSLARTVATLVSSFTFMIGYLLAAFTSRKQALHDMIAGTLVVREKPGRVGLALAIVVLGPLVMVGAITMFAGAMVAGLAGGMAAGMMGGQPQVVTQTVKPVPQAPKAAAPAPALRGASSAADVDKLLTPVAGVDKPGATRAGPGVLELSTFFGGADPKVWIKAYVPPVASGATVIITGVTDGGNQSRYDPKHQFESEFFQNVNLSDSGGRKEGIRSVNLNKGTNEPQVQKVEGVLRLTVPVGMTELTLAAADAGKERSVGALKVKLVAIKGDRAEVEVQGTLENIIATRGFAKSTVVAVQSTSWVGPSPVRVTTTFAGPIERVELLVAPELVRRSYPFTLTRSGAGSSVAAAAPAPAAVAKAPAKAPEAPIVMAVTEAAKPAATPRAKEAPKEVQKEEVKEEAKEEAVVMTTGPGAVDLTPKSADAPAAAPAVVLIPKSMLGGPTIPGPKFNDLTTAVLYRDAATVNDLISFGKWPDKADSNGSTPLMLAVELGDAPIAEALLKAGANATRAMPVAREKKNAAMISLLERHGAR